MFKLGTNVVFYITENGEAIKMDGIVDSVRYDHKGQTFYRVRDDKGKPHERLVSKVYVPFEDSK